MRVLQAPTNIANQAWAAAQGLRSRGHTVEVWHYGPNPFGFPADRTVDQPREPARIMALFTDALERGFEVFHFHFARSLVPAAGGLPWFWDLPMLRALGKRVLFTFHGTDVRLRSVHAEEDPWSYYRFADVACDEERIARSLDVIRTYADTLIVASPLNLRYVPDAVYVPKLLDLAAYHVSGPVRDREPLVVHVPSRRATKGTEFVLRTVERVAERASFRFRLAEALTNDELRGVYADADVVVDNLLLGDCEVSGLEAMAMGKPLITRIRDEVRAQHPDLPALHADPDGFEQALRRIVADAALRRELGERGRAYVEASHDAAVVAATLEERYAAEPRPVFDTFPGWVSPPREDRAAVLEERTRALRARVEELDLRLDARARRVRELEAEVARLQRLPLVRASRGARALLGRLRGVAGRRR